MSLSYVNSKLRPQAAHCTVTVKKLIKLNTHLGCSNKIFFKCIFFAQIQLYWNISE